MTDTSYHDARHYGALPWLALTGVLLAWGGMILTLAEAGTFRQGAGLPPFRLTAAIVLPVLAGVLIWNFSAGFRAWTNSWDLAAIVAVQHFRVLGVVFLFFWWNGSLPLVFAWVAGLGDIAVGLLAIPTTLAVARRTAGWQAKVRRLTLLGILDFGAVFTLATLSQEGNLLNFAGQPTPAAMQAMPMIMIPGFLVPIFILLHLLQSQRARA